MPHETPLIATIVIALGLAFVLGAIANRFKVPPLVGYLLAGVVVGPFTPGFVADQSLAPQLAEIGVILLMFGVGLHFSLKDLLSVKAIAVPGAVVQIAIATILGYGIAWWLGWTPAAGLVFGLALSVASTVVLLRALQERRILETERGRIAVGWLIVEDLAMVLALVLLPALAQILQVKGVDTPHVDPMAEYVGPGLTGVLIVTFIKVALFVALMLIVGRKVIPWVLHYVAHTGSRELFRLAVLAIALGVAFGATELFGVSLALGAFFAGMVLSESQLSHRAAEETLPLRDAFAVLFFVAAGMLFDPMSLLRDPLPVIATLFVILIGKSLAAFLIVRAFRHPVATALTISASLAQIGEFSFILADVGLGLGLIPKQARDLILAGAILSILLNPLAFAAVDLVKARFDRKPTGEAPVSDVVEGDLAKTALNDHIVLVGYGRVGGLVAQALQEKGRPFLVIEDASARIQALKERHIEVIPAHAARPETLAAANIAGARLAILAIPNGFEAGRAVELARAVNPGIRIIARAHSDEEVDYLSKLGADMVIMGEREIARGMIAALGEPAKPETPSPVIPDAA
ncbi:MAG TPA: YbaL family putative K(+) efflux transporter [Nordella sp.]|nr:YbaL family putative K(+) efflux transporter [Nordella sp.]